MNRRDFFKQLPGLVALPLLLPGTDAGSRTKSIASEAPNVEKPWNYLHWTDTIFVQTENQAILEALDIYAGSTGCYFRDGKKDSPDIIALPYFAAVVDRTLVGRDNCDSFLQFRDEVTDLNLCIVVDACKDWPTLDWDPNIRIIDPGEPQTAKQIVDLIRRHRKSYLNR